MMLRDNAQATVPELITNPLSSVGKSSKPKVGKTIPGPWKKTPQVLCLNIFAYVNSWNFASLFFSPMIQHFNEIVPKILAYIVVFSAVYIICRIWKGQKILFFIKKSMAFKIFFNLFSKYQ